MVTKAGFISTHFQYLSTPRKVDFGFGNVLVKPPGAQGCMAGAGERAPIGNAAWAHARRAIVRFWLGTGQLEIRDPCAGAKFKHAWSRFPTWARPNFPRWPPPARFTAEVTRGRSRPPVDPGRLRSPGLPASRQEGDGATIPLCGWKPQPLFCGFPSPKLAWRFRGRGVFFPTVSGDRTAERGR